MKRRKSFDEINRTVGWLTQLTTTQGDKRGVLFPFSRVYNERSLTINWTLFKKFRFSIAFDCSPPPATNFCTLSSVRIPDIRAFRAFSHDVLSTKIKPKRHANFEEIVIVTSLIGWPYGSLLRWMDITMFYHCRWAPFNCLLWINENHCFQALRLTES